MIKATRLNYATKKKIDLQRNIEHHLPPNIGLKHKLKRLLSAPPVQTNLFPIPKIKKMEDFLHLLLYYSFIVKAFGLVHFVSLCEKCDAGAVLLFLRFKLCKMSSFKDFAKSLISTQIVITIV